MRASTVAAAFAGALWFSVPSARAAAFDARLDGSFAMNGKLTFAHNVYGEHVGQRVTRAWTFRPSCATGVCERITLQRRRSGRQTLDVLILRRRSRGVYFGQGRFWVPLSCAGRVEPRGGVATERITVRITRTAVVGNTGFATRLGATYENPIRTNLTRCPGGIGRDRASYTGRLASALPGPPTASFTVIPDPVTMTASFTDQSRPGRGNTPIIAWRWSFGDPLSPENNSTQMNPTHHFTAAGTYTVTLAVYDKYGLTTTMSQEITV